MKFNILPGKEGIRIVHAAGRGKKGGKPLPRWTGKRKNSPFFYGKLNGSWEKKEENPRRKREGKT